MAITVSIIRQPLYGSVSWNGSSFIYTPNDGFSGSDSFVYSEYIDGVQNIYTKYVNTSNTPPVALPTTLSASPYIITEIDVNSVVIDYNNPFNYLQFTDVSTSLNNKITTDGSKIYYTPNTPNALDIINYKVSDKQFTVTGTILVNVLSASGGADYAYSPLEKLYQFKDITSSYERNSSGWTGSYNVYAQYGTSWDTIDLSKYEGFADIVVGSYAPWNAVYDYRNIYYSVYSNLCSNSGVWIANIPSGNYYHGIINPQANRWNDVYSILTSGSGNWNNSITKFNILSSNLYYTTPLFSSVYNTVTGSSASVWDQTDLNNWNSIYANLLRNTYSYTSANSSRWIAPVSGYQSLSSGMASVVANVKDAYTAVFSNSATLWDNSSLNSLSAKYYNKWTLTNAELSTNQIRFNEFSISVNSVSAGVDIINTSSNLLVTTVSSNSATTWENTTNENFLSSNSANWVGLYLNLTANSGIWYGSNDITNVINDNTPKFNFISNSVSSNSANLWGNLDENSNLTLSNSSNFSLLYTLLTAKSGIWSSPSDIGTVISSNSSVFDSIYNFVLSNSASTWDDSNTNLLSSNSGYWNNVYRNILNNSSSWNSAGNIGTIISNISSNLNSSYQTVSDNYNTNWTNELSTTVIVNSSKWYSSYNIMTGYSGSWTSGNSLFDTITNDKLRYNSTFNTITANSAINWTGLTIYASISDNVIQFQNLKNIFYVIDSDSLWSNIQPIYSNTFNSYYYPYFNSNMTTTQNSSGFWDTTYVIQILSGLSADLTSNYNLITASTSKWVFTEDPYLKNAFSFVSANSGKLNNEYIVLTSALTSWNNNLDISKISNLSAQYLSGSETVNVSSRNLFIYGNLVVGVNLSALGSKTSISTSNYSLTGFEVLNDSNVDCFVITKTSNLNNVATFSSVSAGPVLWIRSDNKVGINTALPTQALTIVGDVSASGIISNYLGSQITVLQSNSGKYEAGYTFATTTSSLLTAFDGSKQYYDTMTNYYNNSSTTINTLVNNNPLYSSISDNISLNYPINNNVNTFVSYSTGNANIDTIYRTVTGKYDNSYNTLTSVCALQVISLNYLFSFNKVVSSDKARLYIPYNLKIISWSVFADQATNLTIDVLSGYGFNKTINSISITNNNPISAVNTAKATQNQLDTIGWTTSINVGATNPSFIQFNLTKNDSASAVMVNLKAYKI